MCFETLNPTDKGTVSVNENMSELREIFDINEYSLRPNADLELPRTPVICKPFEQSFEQVFEIANINPHKTVVCLLLFLHNGLN